MKPWHCGDESLHAAHVWQLDGESYQCVGTDAAGAEIARRTRFARLPRWEPAPAPIVWGSTMCGRKRCVELAEVSLDGEPRCIAHADEEIERACVPPEFARLLPELDE